MSSKKNTKKSTYHCGALSTLDEKIGVAALYLRGLQFHRSDAGYLLMEYIDYLELTDKVENPNRDAKNWIAMYNLNSTRRQQLKRDIVQFISSRTYSYYRILNTLFGKGKWQKPINS